MNEKEMIEEMARIMCGNDCEECAKETAEWRGVSFEKAKAEQCLTKKQAELLYEQGYRKIPEGSVVVDKEYLKKELQGLEAQVRKETAERFVNETMKRKQTLMNPYTDDESECVSSFWIYELAKQFGAEVEV